ncbi:MAG: hypothetical protein A2176_09375 [Spirochaetes bacterium RBG_13_51_14]|nr:MAG: hypothetical protein A2176_09375 [Spirochaetes bacterium RBG_13_51_14]
MISMAHYKNKGIRMKNTISAAHLILIPLATVSLALVSCADGRYPSESNIRQRYKNIRSLNDTAAFLAGTEVNTASPLRPLVMSDQYRAYRESIGALWDQFRNGNLADIEKWRRSHLRDGEAATVMYPFSGPDILNALAFFPDAEEFVMIGLETPGTAPDPLSFQGQAVYAELWRIRTALRTILRLNLFRTQEMHVDLRPESFGSVTGIMMFFLARYGYEILDVRRVYIDTAGDVAEWIPRQGDRDSEGVEFVFRKGAGAPLQTARFFSIDLSDASLSLRRGFASFLASRNRFITFIKSASYLLSYDNFKISRSYLLACSRCIVQEDSGIPLKYFAENEWKISFYGAYRILPMFASRFQPELDAAMREKSKGHIPFSFGYGFDPKRSNIMIARRAARR